MKPWSGDTAYVLPAASVEPYRLWFEFLKLSLSDPEIEVDLGFYEPWGSVEAVTFNEWWGPNWRTLFAVRSGVEELRGGSVVPSDRGLVSVSIPLTGKTDDILGQVSKLLETRGAEAGINLTAQGRFALSVGYEQGFLKQLDKARRYLRLYGYWLKYRDLNPRKRVERAAKDHHRWFVGWETRIKERGLKKRITPLPYFYKTYVAYLDDKARGKKAGQVAHDQGNAETARRQIVRDISQARKLAANVGRGVFPGRY